MSDPLPPPSESCPRCAALAAAPPRTGGRALTPERKRVFLETLARTGSTVAASAQASPWTTDGHMGLSTFRDERKRDLEFAIAWDAALERAQATVEAEVMRRAMEPTIRPVFSKGELVGQEEKFDNYLLLRLATKLNPEWSDKKTVEVSGSITHNHHAVAEIRHEEVLLLDGRDVPEFLRMLETIVERRDAPRALEAGPTK